MDEINRRKWREDVIFYQPYFFINLIQKNKDIHESNKEKMEYKDYLKSLEKNEKQLQVQESLRQVNINFIFLLFKSFSHWNIKIS